MGKDFIPMERNFASESDKKKIIKKLYWSGKVMEASSESYFRVLPPTKDIAEIDVGTSGTNETVFRFKDGTFAVVEGTVPEGEIFPSRSRQKKKMKDVS
jgi:hypothetical protein